VEVGVDRVGGWEVEGEGEGEERAERLAGSGSD